MERAGRCCPTAVGCRLVPGGRVRRALTARRRPAGAGRTWAADTAAGRAAAHVPVGVAGGGPVLLRRLIGAALRRERLRLGLTLRDLAALARVSTPYLSEVERGTKEVSSEVLSAICRALGITLAELLEQVVGDLAAPGPAGPPVPRPGTRMPSPRSGRPCPTASPEGWGYRLAGPVLRVVTTSSTRP